VGLFSAVDALLVQVDSLILYEADGLIVLNKPPGLASTGRSLEDTNCAQYLLMARARRMVWAIHQLDADTSGLNLFASRRTVVPAYQQRMATPNGTKMYLAICRGLPDFDERIIDAPMGPTTESGAWRYGVHPKGKPARTRVVVRARGPHHALVTAELYTGRTHQIRVHMAHIGHPLVGEVRYQDPPSTEHHRQALHAWRLRFADGRPPASFEAPVPDDFARLAERLGVSLDPGALP
jgi:RluA family pseudouridine synthase